MQEHTVKYTLPAIVLHWIIAVLIFTMFGLGWYMVELPRGPDRSWFFALHKSIGLTVFLLVLARVAWRLTHRPPPWPEAIPLWRRKLAASAHALFYLLMFLQPVTGYLSSSFSGYKTSYFGLPLPHWGWKDKVLNDLFSGIHEASSVLLGTLIVAHVLGALSHAFKRGDPVFRRMLP